MRTSEIRVLGSMGDVRRMTEGKVEEAIGYLMAWALNSEVDDHVSLTVCATDAEVSAYYSPRKGVEKGGMLMVAVWRSAEGRYSYHT